MAYKKKRKLLPKDYVMAYKKKNHDLLPEDCVLTYKKKKHHLLLEDCIMTYKKKKHHLLPEDCVIQILLKLPIKSILRFKCVSKSWYSLLISSYFINTYMKLNEKTKLLFINIRKGKFLSFNLKDESFVSELDHSLKYCNVVGCCNGIICLRSSDDKIILFNPSMREFKVLPHFTHFVHVRRSIGFGFDDLNNDYKVILILSVFQGHPYTYETAIYSFRSNTWKKSENENRSTISEYVGPIRFSLFFNGRAHWDAYHCHNDYNYDDELMIFSMDISSEIFYEFQYPEPVLLWKNKRKMCYRTNFQVIQGSLSVILFRMMPNYVSLESEQYIYIWSMKEYGVIESWSKQYTIGPYFSITRADFVVSLLSIRENEDEVEEEDHLLIQIGSKNICELVRWNLLKNEEVQKYYLEDLPFDMETLCYSQSLVSIDKNNLDYI